MEIDINALRHADRNGGEVLPSGAASEGSQGSGQEDVFRQSLEEAMQTCQLAKNYNESLPQWHIATSTLQSLGCPYALVKEYENMLKSYFQEQREKEAKRYMDFIIDNHGDIIH